MRRIFLASAVFVAIAAASAQAGFLDDLGSALDNAAKDIGGAIEGDAPKEEPSLPEASPAVEPVKKKFKSLSSKFLRQ